MPTLRDNYAYIYSEDVEKITFLPDSWHVTSGQPMTPPPEITRENDQFLILFRAGRHKSKQVADKFNEESGGDGHMFSPFTVFDAKPGEMNFSFGLKIHWKNGGSTDVVLGQGSTMSHNNWWIGSGSIASASGGASIETPNGVLRITGYEPQTKAVSGVEVSNIDASAAAAAIPPFLVWIIEKIGEEAAREVAKLIMANVNSFRIRK